MSNVSHPAHYNQGKIEVIEFIEDKNLNFHLGNAVKYIARAGKKDPAKHQEDLEKAKWYLEREIEIRFAVDVRRPNDMREEPKLERREAVENILENYALTEPAPKKITTAQEIGNAIFELLDQAKFEDWEKEIQKIVDSVEAHPRASAFRDWEKAKEEREELEELCVEYGLEDFKLVSNEDLHSRLRPLIEQELDAGNSIGNLERKILGIDRPQKKKAPKKEFPHDQFQEEGAGL